MIDIGYKSPCTRMWWWEYQVYVPMQTTALYCLVFTNMYDFNDQDMYIWNRVCSDSWR
jgi:hypothetical protein